MSTGDGTHPTSGGGDDALVVPAEQLSLPHPESDTEAAALRTMLEGTSHRVGVAFLESLVQHLCKALGTNHAFITEFLGDQRVRTLAFWSNGRIVGNVEWDLPGTPCEKVIGGNLCLYPDGIWRRFPLDQPLVDMRIESFIGVPLLDVTGKTLGHLAVFDEHPMSNQPQRLYTFRIFAARAAAELQRLRTEQQLAESERRYRDLYDEAPIAYIYEDLESRFVRANQAALKLLGIKPSEVTDTYGVNLLAPTEETRRRIADALEAMKTQGKEFACVEIELRRKDNGQPVYVQWWSKPEPDGRHTRTMVVDITDRVLMQREKNRLEQQNLYLQEEIKQAHNFEEIVGKSPALLAVLDNVSRVAPTEASVLITGETGTGKELVARAIHSRSSRKDKPLIKVNCAALPMGLVESELFGHERGAFSGAIARHIGRFELAHGGTIFLDEVGDIPLDVQVKLLRVLQEKELERVGGTTPIRADVRVIAATNRDLTKAIAEGGFREDLFYRLNVFPIQMPPLRQRIEDIPLLVRFVMRKAAAGVGKRIESIDAATMQRLGQYRWPGNVRELQNVIERAVILSTGPTLEIGPEQLPAGSASEPAPSPSGEASLRSVERDHILAALARSNWVIEGPAGAAATLELHPNTLRSRMKKLGIERPTQRLS